VVVEVVSEVANDQVGRGAEVATCVLDCACVLVEVVEIREDDAVTTSMPGHSDAIPMPNWNTPMMLVSPTSTSLHTFLISSPMSCRPWTHAELQRAGGEKSLAWQPLMVVVYAARHWTLFWMSTRGTKLERETVAEVPVMKMARPSTMDRIVVCIAGELMFCRLWQVCRYGLSLLRDVENGSPKVGLEMDLCKCPTNVWPRVERRLR
jgi:hypothetical protein